MAVSRQGSDTPLGQILMQGDVGQRAKQPTLNEPRGSEYVISMKHAFYSMGNPVPNETRGLRKAQLKAIKGGRDCVR